MKTATKVQKQVQVIARIEIKKNGIVVYKVRSSNGIDIYQTTFFNGKATGCTCASRKPCYHMAQLQAREDARLIAHVDTMIAQVTEKQERFCDRCHKKTDEYRVQDGEVLCERCIKELERNAQPKLHSCDTCWRQVKPEFITCSVCLGQ